MSFQDIATTYNVIGKYLCLLLVTCQQALLILLGFVTFRTEGNAKFP
jgi:hypothetical protein